MNNRTRPAGRRRGIGTVEVLVGGSLAILVLVAAVPFLGMYSRMWRDTQAASDVQRSAQTAAHEMARHIRMGRRVIVAEAQATHLALRLPALDNTGKMVIPVQDGDIVRYYVGNLSGARAERGGLWRSVNGTPDRGWSLLGGTYRTPLEAGGLVFTYLPGADPDTVAFQVTTTQVGARTRTFSITQEVVLRNHSWGIVK